MRINQKKFMLKAVPKCALTWRILNASENLNSICKIKQKYFNPSAFKNFCAKIVFQMSNKVRTPTVRR